MNVLLSVNPRYIESIFDGTKRYEYRRMMFKRNDITSIIIYATSPLKQIIGEFTFIDYIQDNPEEIWRQTKKDSGLNRDDFFNYFSGIETGYAISIVRPRKYTSPIDPSLIFADFVPPQSFSYLHPDIITSSAAPDLDFLLGIA